MPPRPARDPERTRARILAAALAEFASRGLAGARVDAIAAAAGVNKRMLYHYYGHKDDLYNAVLQDRLERRGASMASAPDDPLRTIEMFQREVREDTDWVRFLMWEALEQTESPLVGECERQSKCATAVAMIERMQANGFLPGAHPAHLALSMMAMVLWPYAFPQFARMMTGLDPASEEFLEARLAFFRSLTSGARAAPAPESSRRQKSGGGEQSRSKPTRAKAHRRDP
ncbi:MAG: TetR/AcrR family transcriptional regulator [Polyangiaceae bacterium]|nr:TetR/AcrR family transcriptional regulator [Polyangiaceae bacterium]